MRIRTFFAAALVLGLTIGGLPGVGLPAASAYPTSDVKFEGHGWGHGRGMGQFGALGYALNYGWSWQQILDHYYSNTTDGNLSDDVGIVVHLSSFDNVDTIVQDPSGANARINHAGTPAAAFRVRRTGANQFAVDSGPNCSGPWVQVQTGLAGPVNISSSGSDGTSSKLQTCGFGDKTYRGDIDAYDSGGARTASATLMKWYLRGVVPAESSASWGSLGGGAGMNALRAQAVAARSYAGARLNKGFPDICDTTACQVYAGVGVEAASTNTAVSDTAGHVRLLNGAVASTEFSSSTGGQTAGGTFPSVADLGDDVCVPNVSYACNPNHNWSTTVPVSTIESRFGVGTLIEVRVTERTPEDGGLRAKTVMVKGTSATKTVDGETFRSTLNLKSTWFSIVCQSSGGVNGYWVLGSDGGVFSFCGAGYYGSTGGWRLNKPVVAMAATKTGKGYWLLASDGGIFSFGDAQFYGSTGGWRLNAPIVGMAVTPTGQGYWLLGADGGVFSFGDAAGKFYGSTGGWRLNAPVVGMVATSTGNGYWLVASDGGVFSFGDAAGHFYGSMGGKQLARPVIGMAPRADDSGYWQSAADGGIFAFNAPYLGSLPGLKVAATAVGMRPTATGNGYLIAASDGQVYSFGDAPVLGDVQDAIPGWGGRAIGIEVSKGS